MHQIVCEKPRIIVNPLLPDLLNTYRDYYIRGQKKRWCGHYSSYDFPYMHFSPKYNNITINDLDSSYLIDTQTGDMIPIYQVVPCGHCAACEVNKQNAFVHRCELETQCYNSKPWFVTLTYDNDHVPQEEIEGKRYNVLKVRDVQLFLKRFRINLERKGIQDSSHPLRYIVCGEFGKSTHRPHYHMILWNVQAFTPQGYSCVFDILESSWKNGFCTYRVVNPEDDNGRTFRYTTKYLHKHHHIHVPLAVYYSDKFKQPFRCSSTRHGGIGSRFIDSHRDNILSKDAKYLNLYNGVVSDIYFNSYIVNRLFPSYSRLVPASYRNACRELVYYDYDGTYDSMIKKLRKENPCYIPKKVPMNIKEPHYFSAEECYREILRWRKHVNYVNPDEARKMHIQREKFLLYVMQDIPEKDIKHYLYKSKQILNRQYSLEQL